MNHNWSGDKSVDLTTWQQPDCTLSSVPSDPPPLCLSDVQSERLQPAAAQRDSARAGSWLQSCRRGGEFQPAPAKLLNTLTRFCQILLVGRRLEYVCVNDYNYYAIYVNIVLQRAVFTTSTRPNPFCVQLVATIWLISQQLIWCNLRLLCW